METVARGIVIGERLRELRDRALLTQEELSEISKIEHGGSARPSTVRKLAAALEVDPYELLKGGS